MPSSDPWLARQNAALKLKGHGVTLDVAGSRVRLRATMPPRPTDPPGSAPKQQRISTGLVYPDQSSQALELAEKLGNALERHRVGAEAGPIKGSSQAAFRPVPDWDLLEAYRS